jgi:hypothetical protein
MALSRSKVHTVAASHRQRPSGKINLSINIVKIAFNTEASTVPVYRPIRLRTPLMTVSPMLGDLSP